MAIDRGLAASSMSSSDRRAHSRARPAPAVENTATATPTPRRAQRRARPRRSPGCCWPRAFTHHVARAASPQADAAAGRRHGRGGRERAVEGATPSQAAPPAAADHRARTCCAGLPAAPKPPPAHVYRGSRHARGTLVEGARRRWCGSARRRGDRRPSRLHRRAHAGAARARRGGASCWCCRRRAGFLALFVDAGSRQVDPQRDRVGGVGGHVQPRRGGERPALWLTALPLRHWRSSAASPARRFERRRWPPHLLRAMVVAAASVIGVDGQFQTPPGMQRPGAPLDVDQVRQAFRHVALIARPPQSHFEGRHEVWVSGSPMSLFVLAHGHLRSSPTSSEQPRRRCQNFWCCALRYWLRREVRTGASEVIESNRTAQPSRDHGRPVRLQMWAAPSVSKSARRAREFEIFTASHRQLRRRWPYHHGPPAAPFNKSSPALSPASAQWDNEADNSERQCCRRAAGDEGPEDANQSSVAD